MEVKKRYEKPLRSIKANETHNASFKLIENCVGTELIKYLKHSCVVKQWNIQRMSRLKINRNINFRLQQKLFHDIISTQSARGCNEK